MKWAGALMIVAAAYICGASIAAGERKRLRACESMIALLTHMNRRISFERAPLYEIFASFRDSFLEEVGFLPLIRAHRRITRLQWSQAVETLPAHSELKRELLHFGQELGSIPLEEQKARIASCTEALTDLRTRLQTALPAKEKSIKTVSLLAGLLTVIVLF